MSSERRIHDTNEPQTSPSKKRKLGEWDDADPDVRNDSKAVPNRDSVARTEHERAARENHNATNCRLFTLCAELRNQIFENVVAEHQYFRSKSDLTPKNTGFLQTCRFLRRELSPLYWNGPRISLYFCETNLRAGRLDIVTMQRWLESVLEVRDFTYDKLRIGMSTGVDRFRTWHDSVSVSIEPMDRWAREHGVSCSKCRHDETERDAHGQLHSVVKELNERFDNEGKCMEKEDVLKAVAVWFNPPKKVPVERRETIQYMGYSRPNVARRRPTS